jgi:peptide deformylase
MNTVTVLRLRILPDPILRQKAKKVGKVPLSMKKFSEDMIETMHAEEGVGLAANQVGALQKVAVIQLPEWEEALVLINPEIVKQEGEREIEEGCLSIPGYRGLVKRSERVRARALGLDGKVIRIRADELLAQALEHEIDHLNGVLYIDRLVSPDSLWKVPQPEEGADPDGSGHLSGGEVGDSRFIGGGESQLVGTEDTQLAAALPEMSHGAE